MFNAKNMLGQLLGAAQGMAAPKAGNTSSSGSLLDGLGGLLGGAGRGGASSGGGLLGGLGNMVGGGQSGSSSGGGLLGGIGNMLKDPKVAGVLGGGGGLLAGLLLGNKKTRSVGGKLALAGGAAALGTMAMKAFRGWQRNRSAQPAAPAQGIWKQPQGGKSVNDIDFNSMSEDQQESHSRAMLTAIIAAAKADGQFDAREQQIIKEYIGKMGDAETVEWVQNEINRPLDAGSIAALATSPEMAAEIYLASLIVIDEQNDREKVYLDALASKLGMDQQLRQAIEQQLSQAAA